MLPRASPFARPASLVSQRGRTAARPTSPKYRLPGEGHVASAVGAVGDKLSSTPGVSEFVNAHREAHLRLPDNHARP